MQGRDFTCIPETLNALEAWLGSLPAHLYANVRQATHLDPQPCPYDPDLGGLGGGPDRNDHLDGPPLFHAETDGTTPFRFSAHVGDVGHTLIVGPTGAGKSVLAPRFMALQVPPLTRVRRSSPSTSAARSAAPRSPWAEIWENLGDARPTRNQRCSCSRSRA